MRECPEEECECECECECERDIYDPRGGRDSWHPNKRGNGYEDHLTLTVENGQRYQRLGNLTDFFIIRSFRDFSDFILIIFCFFFFVLFFFFFHMLLNTLNIIKIIFLKNKYLK